MKIRTLLLEKKEKILQKWFDALLSSYSVKSAHFMKDRNNSFSASVAGEAMKQGMECMFQSLVVEKDDDFINSSLDRVIRVRAVQELNPAEAIGFIFALKQIIREVLREEILEHALFQELLELESQIDSLATLSFNVYTQCREKLYELRANEMRNWTYRAIKKSKMYREVRAEE